jgi:hypothetical protein
MAGPAQAGAMQKIANRAAWQNREIPLINLERQPRFDVETIVRMSGISDYPCLT